MIDKKIYSKEYIDEVMLTQKCDPTILERTIFAFGLLEALVAVGARFIFKGGTSLMLLMDTPLRLSTDIDIIAEPGIDMEVYVKKASEVYPFVGYEENKRKGANNIVKQHFRFFFRSVLQQGKEISVLLDILYEENHYANVIEREIHNSIVCTEGLPTMVIVPSVESILGDKLTAFAPHTIGVKPVTEYENRIIDKKIEVVKQFFDVASLYDVAENQREITESYFNTAGAEIRYRGLNISPEECLRDTFNSALSIYSKGKFYAEDYKDYLFGIRGLGGFLINTKFNGETVFRQAAKVMYLSACILNDKSITQEVPEAELLTGEYAKLNQTRKIDRKAFDMMAYSLRLMEDFSGKV